MTSDNSPATKKDLVELRSEILAHVSDVRSEILTHIDQRSDQLVEQMRDMQTEVLRAFHDWARPIESRISTLPKLDERIGWLEERISRLERDRGPAH